jgi:uncharacterized protein
VEHGFLKHGLCSRAVFDSLRGINMRIGPGMKLSGNRQLNAPQAEVWAKLNDTDVLARCIPGCEKLERVGENELKALVGLKIGPMNTKFTGDVTLSDMQPPNSYRISGTGKGGPAGMASGGANVKLEAKDGGTLLTYDVDANVSGKIAQLGQRLIDATAAQLAEKFFTNFAAEVEPAAVDLGDLQVAALTDTEAAAAGVAARNRAAKSGHATGQSSGQSSGMPGWVWGVSGAIALAILYFVLKR